MDIYQKRDFILGLRNMCRCLDCTREDIINKLEGTLINVKDAKEIRGIIKMLDNVDAQTDRNYKP